MATKASRSARDAFQHHAEVMIAGDPEGVSDYAEDAGFITQAGVLRGKDEYERLHKVLGICPTLSETFIRGS